MDPDTDPFQAERALRGITSDLVKAAEAVVSQAAEHKNLPEKSQLAKLGAVCAQAVCKEEIENYIRYQAGRDQWKLPFANAVLEAIESPLGQLEGHGAQVQVEAWRRYAVFMHRALVYEKKARKKADRKTRSDDPDTAARTRGRRNS